LFFRQLALFLVIETIINSVTIAENTCVTEEMKKQFGSDLKVISDNYYILRRNRIYSDMSNQKVNLICSQAFAGMINLETLNFSQNRLTVLLKNTFKPLINIINIDLSENQLTAISFDEFADNQQLKWLNLASNNILIIESIQHQDGCSITTLWFNSNELVDISKLCNLTKLRRLDLSSNKELDFNSFKPSCWNHLQMLDLKNTTNYQLRADLKNMETLYHSNNNLGVLCVGNLPTMPELKFLDVRENQLESLNAEVLQQKFPNLKQLVMSKILWTCDEFNVLTTDLKKIGVEITGNERDFCVKRSIATASSSNSKSDICGTQNSTTQSHAIICSILFLNFVLCIATIVLGYQYILHREVSKDVVFE
jgi:Leucine-rich repeat (LRR) protein